MLAEKGLDYYEDIPLNLRTGSYFRRETYFKELSDEEVQRIPEKQRKFNESGKIVAIRTHIVQFQPKYPLSDTQNKSGVLFNHEESKYRR